jgi:hypothetical protein
MLNFLGENYMRLNIKLTTGIVLFFLTSTAFAGPSFRGLYFGGSFTRHDIKDIDERFNGAMIKLGYDVTNFLGIEAHGGATTKQTFSESSGAGTVDAQFQHAGIYARLNWRETNSMLYALVGYSYFKIHEDFTSFSNPANNDTYDENLSGLSYGIGAELFGSGRTSVTANLMQLIKEKDEFGFEWNVLSAYIGITHYFRAQKTTHAQY